MTFLCSTFGSSGDVFPMLGLALELRRRGHDILFATNEHYRRIAERHGLAFEPLGSEEGFRASISNPELWQPRKAFPHVFRSIQPVLKTQYDLHAAFAGRPDTVAVTNLFGFGAFLAQEKLGLPAVTLHVQPAVLWSRHAPPTLPRVFGPRWLKHVLYGLGERFVIDPVVTPFLNEWRRELGLPPVRRVTRYWHSPYAVLCLFPEWYAPPQPDWPANLLQADFPLWTDQTPDGLPADVEAFLNAGDPPLVFIPGSANAHGRRFFEAAVEACRQLDRRGVLLTEFPEQLPPDLPEAVAHFRYVPLDLLLPRASAFVHHGGIGATSQGFAAAVPQVLVPLAHDQFDNAERVTRLGAGDSLAIGRLTGSRLAERLKALLTSDGVKERCRELSRWLQKRDGLSRAADMLLERVQRK